MEWIALAIVFCFLMWKWPRKTIIGVCGVVSFAAIVGIGCFTKIKIDDYKKESDKKLVFIEIDYPPQTGKMIKYSEYGSGIEAWANGKWVPAISTSDKKIFFADGKRYATSEELQKCPNDYPLYILIKNNNKKELNFVSFQVNGKRYGRSGYLLSWWESGGKYSSDYIIKPGETYGTCWKMPPIEGSIPPRSIEWVSRIDSVTFSE